MEDDKRKFVEEKHKYKITLGKDDKWRTYVNPEKGKYKLICKRTEDDLYETLYDYYKNGYQDKQTKKKGDLSTVKEINFWNIKEGMYLISPIGDIYSAHLKQWKHTFILDKTGNYQGNIYVKLMTYEGERMFSVARLVCAAFNGLPPEDMDHPTVDHIDGNTMNNHYTNLRWLEHDVNSSIRKNRGVGEENSRAILSEDDVKHICNLLCKHKKTIEQIADDYHVSVGAIEKIYQYKNWYYISRWFEFA